MEEELVIMQKTLRKFQHREQNGVHFYVIPSFEETGLVRHVFTTRRGGVSSGECKSMNLGLKRKDTRENVIENFTRLCNVLGIDVKNLVLSDQVHRDKLHTVGFEDLGKGIWRESDISGVDGLLTNKPGIALVTFYADCVPLFFLDPEKKAIATSHAGWRGTVLKIGLKTVKEMGVRFGTEPSECLVGIGPSIGPCCFEVDEPVKQEFEKAFGNCSAFIRQCGGKSILSIYGRLTVLPFWKQGLSLNTLQWHHYVRNAMHLIFSPIVGTMGKPAAWLPSSSCVRQDTIPIPVYNIKLLV